MAKERIDRILVDRGLAQTRSRAQAMILAGTVLVSDQRIDKPGQMVDSESEVRIKGDSSKYVSRGGLKLEAALREFDIDPEGKLCLDVGASTGGFTDCLLQRGATRVWALDVGHNQLAWKIRNDARVVVIEGHNARDMPKERFGTTFEIATIDVSFISLTMVVPAVLSVVSDEADIVALIKPQFEVGKGEVGKGGIVRDPRKHRAVLNGIVGFAAGIELDTFGLVESPILGAQGNREFLIRLRKAGGQGIPALQVQERILDLTELKS
jgi:23S rRNA (cytidine1920-2'-O)/16S rRNA (cytidine1409-2'-O)-methyltransferase